jgi:hypothetical protein
MHKEFRDFLVTLPTSFSHFPILSLMTYWKAMKTTSSNFDYKEGIQARKQQRR